MADDTSSVKKGPSDATDYSASKAPETKKQSEEQEAPLSDPRLHPGGAHGAPVDTGMSSLDRDQAISGGRSFGQQDFGRSPGPDE
jgi:hypothetical protein